MDIKLLERINSTNPWLSDSNYPILQINNYLKRKTFNKLMMDDWDDLCLLILGPRQAGKTTLGLHVCEELIKQDKWENLLYLNCDYFEIRDWLNEFPSIQSIFGELTIKKPILFIDEVQRLENPGLFLKTLVDQRAPIKIMATGSSQLEIKSKVREFLTGRQLESHILPLSHDEVPSNESLSNLLLYGCYPKVVLSKEKRLILSQLYNDYINKDIVQILKIGMPDLFQKMVGLLAHSSGQLLNVNQLATDCRMSATTINHYLSVLENTYIIFPIKPFVGNKRTELTSNPICYFLDNGFRNQALFNFNELPYRTDAGLLVENYIFQEVYKFKNQHYATFTISYWRTKGGAEVDFVLHQDNQNALPIEVKYRHFDRPTISRGFRSFISAYQPKEGIIITKDYLDSLVIDNCSIHFIPITQPHKLRNILEKCFVK